MTCEGEEYRKHILSGCLPGREIQEMMSKYDEPLSRGLKLVTDPEIINDAALAVKKAGNLVSKGWNTVKGWFS